MVTSGKRALPVIAAALACSAMAAGAQEMALLEDADLSGWKEHYFEKIPKYTDYSVVQDAEGAPGGGPVLDAMSVDSASGYIVERPLPFSRDTVLSLDYKVVDGTNAADEKTKAGDDFPLRLYLTAKGFVQFRTLILVHSLQYPAGESWTSPYDGTIARFELQAIGGKGDEGEWISSQVPVGRIWEEIYGDVPGQLTGLAFMVDSDNAHGMMHTMISRIAYSP